MPRARARGAALGEAECAAAAPGSGGEPPPGALRALKRLARGSPAGARAAYAGLMGRLREDDCRVRVHALEAAEREARAQQALVQEFYAIRFEYPAFMTDARMVACLAEEALDLAQECQGEGQPEGAA